MTALSSTVYQSQKDIAPPDIDDDATLMDPEELMNNKSHTVGTIWSKAKGMVQISILNPNGLQPEQLSL